MTTFIGRKRETDALARLVGETRLVTVLGAPGMGKTRLALEYVARARLQTPAPPWSSAWICDLSATREAEGVYSELLRALDVRASAVPRVEELAAALAAQGEALVVLDNVEQVAVHVRPIITTLRRLAPSARWLLTSREPLHVEGEALLEVGPLGLPGESLEPRDSEAVQLFVDRARAAGWDDGLDDAEAARVGSLVRWLDGMPLAIELCAPRLRVLSTAELLAKAGSPLALLDGAEKGPARPGTLRSAIDRSLRDLEEDDRRALLACAVFEGSFDAAAASAVLSTNGRQRSASWPLDVLQTLRDRSLLTRTSPASASGRARLSLLLSIRELAWERLEETGGLEKALERHAAYYVHEAAARTAEVDGPHGAEARAWLAEETTNLLAVHRRALAAAPRDSEAVARAFTIALSLERVLSTRGPTTLLLALLDDALAAATQDADPTLRARALLARAETRRIRAERSQALTDLESALAFALAADDRALQSEIARTLGMCQYQSGHLDDARAHFLQAIQAADGLSPKLIGRARSQLALVDAAEGRLDDACRGLEDALAAHRATQDFRFEAMTSGNLGAFTLELRRYAEAERHLARALSIHEMYGERRNQGITVANQGFLAQERGLLEEGVTHYEKALGLLAGLDPRSEGIYTAYLGHCLEACGRANEAKARYEEAIRRLGEVGDPMEGMVLACLGGLLSELGDIERAEGTFAEVMTRSFSAGAPHMPAVLAIHQGRLELSLARRARERGDREEAIRRDESARRRLDLAASPWPPEDTLEPGTPPGKRRSMADQFVDVRLARASLLRALEVAPPSSKRAPDPSAFVLEDSGEWFAEPKGKRVTLRTRRAPRLLLKKLIEQRRASPGVVVPLDELASSGWPGAILDVEAAASHVYTAVWTLRRLGLAGLLVRKDDGYLLDPVVPCGFVSGDEAEGEGDGLLLRPAGASRRP
jgi:predicted ATPase/Tfp pilus assembly protein PilF